MSLSDFIPVKFLELFSDPEFSKALKGYNLFLIKEDHEYREEVKAYFNECLLTSELKPIQRLAEVEAVTGLMDFSDIEEEEEREPTLPDKINEINIQISELAKTIKPAMSNHILADNPPMNLTDLRADFLIEHIETNDLVPKYESGAVNLECRICNRKEFNYFVEHVLEPEYRPKNLSSDYLRKLRNDLFKNAARRHPDKVCIDQSFHGNKELRLLMYKEIEIPEHIISMMSPQPLLSVTE